MKKGFWFLLMLPLLAFVSFDWVTVSLDNRVSVDFPVKPDEGDHSGNPTWTANVNSNGRCMTMIVDFKNYGMDSAQLATEMTNPQFAEDFKGGVLGQLPGASIISEKKNPVLGYKTLEYLIDMGKKDTSAFNIMHNKNIFVGSKMYTLTFFEKTGKPQDKARDQFFNSIKIR